MNEMLLKTVQQGQGLATTHELVIHVQQLGALRNEGGPACDVIAGCYSDVDRNDKHRLRRTTDGEVVTLQLCIFPQITPEAPLTSCFC